MGIIDKLKNMNSDEDDALALGFVAGGTAGIFGDKSESDGEDADAAETEATDSAGEGLE